MKRLDHKEEQEDNKREKRASIGIFLSVAVLFIVIICITQGVEMFMGKAAGNIALVIIALILVFLLYRKEIMDFFRRK